MNGRLIIRNLIRITAIFTLCLCVLIAGCGTGREDETDEPGNDGDNIVNDTGNSGDNVGGAEDDLEESDDVWNSYEPFTGYDVEVHVPESIVSANEEFLSKIAIKDGVGDFKITPLKFGEDPGDFWLALENKNDFPAGAYVTFVLKGSEGEVISAWDNKSRVMAPGDKDLIMGNTGDGLDRDFSSLEITADIRDGAGEGIYETVDEDGYREVGNSQTGRGRKIDLHFRKSRGQVAHDMVVLYDSDGNVVKVRSFVTMGKDAGVYAECDYASYDIYAWRNTGISGKLPDEVCAAYEKAGLKTLPGNDYETMDGRIAYSFTESDDGKLLICCENRTDETLLMRKDGFLIYGLDEAAIKKNDDREYQWNIDVGQEEKVWIAVDEPAGEVWQLLLHPSERLIWDTGIPSGKSFYMFPTGSKITDREENVPEATVNSTGGKLTVAVEWENPDSEQEFHGTVLLIYHKGDRIVSTETLDFKDQYENHLEAEAQYTGDYDSVEPYLQYYYHQIPMEMY